MLALLAISVGIQIYETNINNAENVQSELLDDSGAKSMTPWMSSIRESAKQPSNAEINRYYISQGS